MNKDFSYQKLINLSRNYVHLIILVPLAIIFATQVTAAPGSVDVTQEMSWDAVDASHWQTPIETFNGSIYFAWVDTKLRTMIAKKYPNGSITTTVIHTKTERNKHHTLPSIAIDKNGYVHVVYNMHHDEWQYKISNKPEDISSFTFVGNNLARTIPGNRITYPSFIKDNNSSLFVTFRHRTPGDGGFQNDGSQGLGIAKYNPNARSWSMLGGTNYKFKEKTFFWSNSSRHIKSKPIGYQGYRAKIFFDRNNRMHISWAVFIRPGEGRSHIMYAYSDDGGNTFKRASGQRITSLPITPQNGDVVAQAPKGIFHNQTFVTVTKNGQPMVGYKDYFGNKSTYYKIWNGQSWGGQNDSPATYPGILVTDKSGVITAVGSNKFFRSSDNGKSWEAYKLSFDSASTAIDYEYLSKTNKLRFQTRTGNKVRVLTANFSDSNKSDDSNNSSNLVPPTKLRLQQK